LRHVVTIDERFFKLSILLRGPSLFLIYMLLETGELDVPLWFALLVGSFVFLDVGPSILFLVFPLFFGYFGLFMANKV
jgi:hypothetical protein